MILTISDKDRVKLGTTSITQIKFIATEFDITNDEAVGIRTCREGAPFFFDLFSDHGDWVSGGRFKYSMSFAPSGSEVIFRRHDLHVLSR
jgi:hypothetical protein